eukprot:superscaffoldBa00006159_g21207
MQTNCCISCPGGWSQTILQVKKLDVEVLDWGGYTWVSQLFFSGPHGMVKQTGLEGQFILNWTTSEKEHGENHPICFVVQAVNKTNHHNAANNYNKHTNCPTKTNHHNAADNYNKHTNCLTKYNHRSL